MNSSILARVLARVRNAPLVTKLAGTILLGAAGSGLWDLLFKPGLGWFGRAFLTITTFGSGRIRDLAYESAALDPRPLAALNLVFLAGAFPFFLLGFLVGFRRGGSDEHGVAGGQTPAASSPPQPAGRRMRPPRAGLARLLDHIMFGAVVFLCIYSLVGTLVLNQAVVIWRVFHANLAICSPYLTPVEESTIRSTFASVKSAADYQRIADKLKVVASAHHRDLVSARLW